jgi:hypothetical protein
LNPATPCWMGISALIFSRSVSIRD